MTNEEFAFNYAGKEFMHYGNRVALAGYGSENPYAVTAPPVEICTGGTLEEPDVPHEPVDPGPGTIGGLIREHEGVRGIQFSTDGHGNVQAAYIRGKHGGMKPVGMGDGSGNVSSKIREEKVWKH